MFLSVLRWLGLLVANIAFLIVAYVVTPFLPLFAYKSRWLKFWFIYCMALVYSVVVSLCCYF